MTTHRFDTTIELNGKTATGFRVPDDVVAALGRGKKPPVRVTLGAHTYRSTVAMYGGVFMLPLSADNRTSAGVRAGDTVTVTLELDTEERTVEVPGDLAEALADNPAAKERFDKLSFSKRRQHVTSVESAKQAETRQRRVRKVIEELSTDLT
ncbi:YdeI/OmpD-associated family protein [Nocardia callitridis]|uniref:DUF1905 domain-containing protein n=1 Tax=Nocardia callitridis TaxID=648753 RepID=A0ABP9JT82_9NOCA